MRVAQASHASEIEQFRQAITTARDETQQSLAAQASVSKALEEQERQVQTLQKQLTEERLVLQQTQLEKATRKKQVDELTVQLDEAEKNYETKLNEAEQLVHQLHQW